MEETKKKKAWFWRWAFASVVFRLLLIYFPSNLNLAARPEVSTPLTSLRRLAEGYWLKQSSMSPYAGSMYHGSPLLLSMLGPLVVKRIEGQPNHLICSLVFVIADFMTAMLIRSTGQTLQIRYIQSLKSLDFAKLLENSKILSSGDIAALVYLWSPFTIVTCVGFSTSPIENLVIMLSIYGACTRLVPLAAFGWVIATHLSLYPAILVIPVILLLGYGPDSPPRKLFLQKNSCNSGDNPSSDSHYQDKELTNQSIKTSFSWRPVIFFFLWASVWAFYVLVLCGISVKQYGGLWEMFKRTYGFILTVEDLSPNIGVLWYFFAEVFDFFRNFFLIVFHVNILFMLLPLAIRLKHRPCFLAFVYLAISSMLKSYPSVLLVLAEVGGWGIEGIFCGKYLFFPFCCFEVFGCSYFKDLPLVPDCIPLILVGDLALYLGLLGLFVNELADMHFSFFIFCGFVGVSLLSPVMHNLWIWRGTGNANFYFATAIAYACYQIVLVVESVSSMLNHDRKIRKAMN